MKISYNYDDEINELKGIELRNQNKELKMFIENEDLHFSISKKGLFAKTENFENFEISKNDNLLIYRSFDNLYKSINQDNGNNNIVWISDGKVENKLTIKKAEDKYVLDFERSNELDNKKTDIDVKFNSSESKNNEYAQMFIELFGELKDDITMIEIQEDKIEIEENTINR